MSHAIPSPPRSATSALAELARAEGVAAGPAFLAVVIASRRHLAGDDVVMGVTRAGRERPELRRVVGPLLDHAPVRVDLSGRPTFRALLHRVHEAYRDAMAHKLPLGMIRQVVPDSVAAQTRRGITLAVVSVANFLVLADATVVNVALPAIESREALASAVYQTAGQLGGGAGLTVMAWLAATASATARAAGAHAAGVHEAAAHYSAASPLASGYDVAFLGGAVALAAAGVLVLAAL